MSDLRKSKQSIKSNISDQVIQIDHPNPMSVPIIISQEEK